MSVPKRFKTNKQLKPEPVNTKVLLKTNPIININKHLLFLNFEKKKKSNSFWLNFKVKN